MSETNPVVEDLEKALSDAEAAQTAPEATTSEAAVDALLAGIQQPTNNEIDNAVQAVKDAGV